MTCNDTTQVTIYNCRNRWPHAVRAAFHPRSSNRRSDLMGNRRTEDSSLALESPSNDRVYRRIRERRPRPVLITAIAESARKVTSEPVVYGAAQIIHFGVLGSFAEVDK